MSITAYPFPHLTTVFDSCFTYGVNSPSSGSSSRRLPFSQRIKQRKKVRKINVFPLAECRLGAKKRWALSISGFLLTLFRRRRLPCPPLKMRRHLFIPFQPLHYRQQTQKTSLGCETWQSEGRRREPPERKKKSFFFSWVERTPSFSGIFQLKRRRGHLPFQIVVIYFLEFSASDLWTTRRFSKFEI